MNATANATVDVVTQGLVGDAIGSALESLVNQLATGAADLVVGATTWWLTTPSVDPRDGAVLAAQGALAPVVAAVLVTSVLVAAARLIISRRAEPLGTLAAGLGRFALVSALGLLLLHGALVAGDALAVDLLADAATQFGEFMRTQLVANPENVLVSLLLASVAAVLAILQWLLMELRQAGLLVLAAMFPLAAAGPKAWLYRLGGWVAAIAVYKPAAAFIYFIGFTYLSTGNGQIAKLIAGVMVLLLAVIAMPALMRFFSWTGAHVSGGGGGSGFLGAAGAVAMSQSYQQSHAVSRAQSMEATGPGSQPGDTTTTASPTGAAPTGTTGGTAIDTAPAGGAATGSTGAAGGTASSAGGAGVAGGVAAVADVAVQAAGRARDEMTSPPSGLGPSGPDTSSGDSGRTAGRTAAGSVQAQPPPRDGGRT